MRKTWYDHYKARDLHWRWLQVQWAVGRWWFKHVSLPLTDLKERAILLREVGPRDYFGEPQDMYFTLSGVPTTGRLEQLMARGPGSTSSWDLNA